MMKHLSLRIATLAVVATAISAAAMAEPGDFRYKITEGGNPAQGDYFASSLAVDVNAAPNTEIALLLLAGAPGAHIGAVPNSGNVVAYETAGFNHILDIPNPSPGPGDQFGRAVALRGTLYAIGAPGDDGAGNHSGAVHLVDQNLGYLGTLTNPNPTDNDRFGAAVAFVGDVIVVGAPRDDDGATDSGTVYVYQATNPDSAKTSDGTQFNLILTIRNPGPGGHDFFGSALAQVGSTEILVGAPGDDQGGDNAGSAYLFDGDPFSSSFGQLILTIHNPTPRPNELFGSAVAGLGPNAIVGAYRESDHGRSGGAVYLFDGTAQGETSSPLLTINNPNPRTNPQFGFAVAGGADDKILVGANKGRHGGIAYLFDGTLRGTISEPELVFANPEPQNNDHFGEAVVILANGNVVIGAPLHDERGHNRRIPDAGAMFLFEGIAPAPIETTSVLFAVDPAASNFSITIQGGQMSTSVEPMIFGTIGADVKTKKGKPVGVHITSFDLGVNDYSTETPFLITTTDVKAVLNDMRGGAGPESDVDDKGNFDQEGNMVQFDGTASGRLCDKSFRQGGGPTAGDLPVPFRGMIVLTENGLQLMVPAVIDRTVKNGSGDFEPQIHCTGMMVANQSF